MTATFEPRGQTPRRHGSLVSPFRVVVDGTDVPHPPPRRRALVTLRLMNVGRVVPVDRLAARSWDDKPLSPATDGAGPVQGAV